MIETGKCEACKKVFHPEKKDEYKLLCTDCLNFMLNGNCPVCKSDLIYQNMGAVEGTWKCSLCEFLLDEEVFSSLKRNYLQQKKTSKKDQNRNWSYKAVFESSKNNENFNAVEVIDAEFGIKIDCNEELLLHKGWLYQCQTVIKCITCNNDYYELIRRAYISSGKRYFRRGLVCLNCAEATLSSVLTSDVQKQLKEYAIYPGEHVTTDNGEIDMSETRKTKQKELVESVLSKLKKTSSYYYLDSYYSIKSKAHDSSVFSQNILWLKKGTAVFPYFLNKLNAINLPEGVAICSVPGHDSRNAESFLRILCQEFCAKNDFEDLSSCLKRHKTIVKSSYHMSSRSKSKTLKTVSLVFKEKLAGKTVILVDDVTVTGNTLLSCRDILMESDVYHVFCLSFGRNTYTG